MTKGKKWTLRLLGVAALALLICLCLLGSTMARYTSKGDGSGTLKVALWDLETTDVTLAASQSVSPSDLPYYSDPEDTNSAQERSNPSAYIEAFTLTNNSDVAADVSVELDTSKGITVAYQADFSWSTGLASNEANDYGLKIIEKMGFGEDTEATEFEAIIDGFGLFDIALAYETESETGLTGVGESGTAYLVALEDGDTFTIKSGEDENFYAEVLWTSIIELTGDENDFNNLIKLVPDAYYDEEWTRANDNTDLSHIDWESFSDDVDTILGLYGSTITFYVTWTAVQASTLP